ncbi:hypothetical protein [uncultured Rhodoblastus sp.]|uniref:hypothetical protein n=1 Tax=uncultured Rhodoblastus sp. TaxID=543037 RepID=UPI0025FC3ADB|nr:hypothetical protein [uncultured Rhodoblastus sp.]
MRASDATTAFRRASNFEFASSDAPAINPIAGRPFSSDDAIGHFNSPAAGSGAKPATGRRFERPLSVFVSDLSSLRVRRLKMCARPKSTDRATDRPSRHQLSARFPAATSFLQPCLARATRAGHGVLIGVNVSKS